MAPPTAESGIAGGNYSITAVDMALWDIKGKALGVPVYELLGGRCRPGQFLHAFVEREEPGVTAAHVREKYASGWRWLKPKSALMWPRMSPGIER